MKRLAMLLSLGSALIIVQCTQARSPIDGTWHARANDLPAVTLVIGDDSGKLTGRITFHFQQKIGDVWQVTRDNTEPLLGPQFVGSRLSFRVSHEKAHPGESGPNDPPVNFEMRLTGPNEAMLRSTDYGVGTETKMIRAE